MAKTKTSYISKGQRRSVSRKLCNAIRRDRRAHPPVEDILKRMEARQEIIAKPRGSKQKELREKYIEEERIELQAFKVLEQYHDVGLPRGAAIQAVKTNYIEQLHAKWGPILRKFRDSAKNNNKLFGDKK